MWHSLCCGFRTFLLCVLTGARSGSAALAAAAAAVAATRSRSRSRSRSPHPSAAAVAPCQPDVPPQPAASMPAAAVKPHIAAEAQTVSMVDTIDARPSRDNSVASAQCPQSQQAAAPTDDAMPAQAPKGHPAAPGAVAGSDTGVTSTALAAKADTPASAAPDPSDGADATHGPSPSCKSSGAEAQELLAVTPAGADERALAAPSALEGAAASPPIPGQ